MNKNILYILKTKESAGILLDFIDFLSEETHRTTTFDIEKLILEFFGERKTSAWVGFIRDYFSKNSVNLGKGESQNTTYGSGGRASVENIRAFLEEIENLVRDAETVKIEIPFNPSEDFINKAYEILGKSKIISLLGKKKTGFLLDITVTKSKGEDTKIFVAGKVVDLSIKKVVINYLMSKDVINRYL